MKLSDVFGMLNTILLLGIFFHLTFSIRPADIDERLLQAERIVAGSIAGMERALKGTNDAVLKNSSDVRSHSQVLVEINNDLKAIREHLDKEPVQ